VAGSSRPFRLEIRDSEGRWRYFASYLKLRNAGTAKVYEAGYFGVRVIDRRTGRVVCAWSGRTRARGWVVE
jgi:hypothetical protein